VRSRCLQIFCCHLSSFCVVFRAQMWVSASYFVFALLSARCSSSFFRTFHVSFNLYSTWLGVYQWSADLQIPSPWNSASASVGSADGPPPQTTTTNEHKMSSVFSVQCSLIIQSELQQWLQLSVYAGPVYYVTDRILLHRWSVPGSARTRSTSPQTICIRRKNCGSESAVDCSPHDTGVYA